MRCQWTYTRRRRDDGETGASLQLRQGRYGWPLVRSLCSPSLLIQLSDGRFSRVHDIYAVNERRRTYTYWGPLRAKSSSSRRRVSPLAFSGPDRGGQTDSRVSSSALIHNDVARVHATLPTEVLICVFRHFQPGSRRGIRSVALLSTSHARADRALRVRYSHVAVLYRYYDRSP